MTRTHNYSSTGAAIIWIPKGKTTFSDAQKRTKFKNGELYVFSNKGGLVAVLWSPNSKKKVKKKKR